MALTHFNFESAFLGTNTDVNIILPDKPRSLSPAEFYGSGKKYKVLWLLHGTFGDYTDWLRKSSIELYACERDLVVVMPSGNNANYLNWPNFCLGYNTWDYLFEELMPLVYNWFPASDKREDNFIAGLSMGGSGAMQYAIGHPEKFAGAASLSNAPVNIREMAEPRYDGNAEGAQNALFNKRMQNVVAACGGMDAYRESPANVWDRLPELMKSGALPKLYFCCGTADKLIWERYCKFKEYAAEIGLPATFEESEGFTHEWRFWDLYIQKVLAFFGLDGGSQGNPF